MSEGSIFDQVEQEVDVTVLSELSRLAEKQQTLEKEIEATEKYLSDRKKELENVSRNLIPSILNSSGLSELRLSSGEKIVVKDKLSASIPDKNYTLAYRNMITAEGGDDHAQQIVDSLFKSQVIIDGNNEDVLNLLLDNDIIYESKYSIHPQTLMKYCRDRLESGKTIPEGISVFQFQETKITK